MMLPKFLQRTRGKIKKEEGKKRKERKERVG